MTRLHISCLFHLAARLPTCCSVAAHCTSLAVCHDANLPLVMLPLPLRPCLRCAGHSDALPQAAQGAQVHVSRSIV